LDKLDFSFDMKSVQTNVLRNRTES